MNKPNTCLACGGKLRKLTKTEDWEERQFHISCWREIEEKHSTIVANEYKKKLEKLIEEKEQPKRNTRHYIKRAGLKMEKKKLEKPITIYFD